MSLCVDNILEYSIRQLQYALIDLFVDINKYIYQIPPIT